MDTTCPLCNGTGTQEIHGPTGFLSRVCPRCGYSPADDSPGRDPISSNTTPPPLATNLNLEGNGGGA